MQAIITRYLGPTDYRGSRIRASCERGSLTVSYPHELSGEDVHIYAAQSLVEKFAAEDEKKYGTPQKKNPWLNRRVCGQLSNGDYVHVFVIE